jgi:hypothetical protein
LAKKQADHRRRPFGHIELRGASASLLRKLLRLFTISTHSA